MQSHFSTTEIHSICIGNYHHRHIVMDNSPWKASGCTLTMELPDRSSSSNFEQYLKAPAGISCSLLSLNERYLSSRRLKNVSLVKLSILFEDKSSFLRLLWRANERSLSDDIELCLRSILSSFGRNLKRKKMICWVIWYLSWSVGYTLILKLKFGCNFHY